MVTNSLTNGPDLPPPATSPAAQQTLAPTTVIPTDAAGLASEPSDDAGAPPAPHELSPPRQAPRGAGALA